MVTALKLGLTAQSTRVSTSKEKNTVQVDLPGLMEVLTMVNLLKIISKVQENITGLMVENTMALG